jgi:hypothetical protein
MRRGALPRALVVLVGLVLTSPAFGRSLTISCQRVDDAGLPKKGYSPHVYHIDTDRQTVSHTADYLAGLYTTPPSYTVQAQMTDSEIRWRGRGYRYKLNRYTGELVEDSEHVLPEKYNCKQKIE